MKVPLHQLPQYLAKPLSPLYLVSGDETLLVEEAAQAIREAAQKQGFSERQQIVVDSADWGTLLYADTHNLSLFAEKRVFELDLSNIKLAAANSKLLQEFAAQPPADVVLILRMKKIDSRVEQTAWFKSIEKKGIFIPVWPVNSQQLPGWIMQRAKKSTIQLTQRAAELIAQCCEGNLLAAKQEIEKLQLLNSTPGQVIDENLLRKLSIDNAHFDIFNLVDSALCGSSARSLRILNHLQAEGIEPTLILWALANELRVMNALTQQVSKGQPLASLYAKYRVFEKRQASVQQFLRRHPQKSCWNLLILAAEIDRFIKGAESGNLWDGLQKLTLGMSA